MPIADESNTAAPPNDSCTACHPIETMITAKREGFHHFERVHSVVLDRQLSCGQCHTNMLPFRPETHARDPVAELTTCRTCHLARNTDRARLPKLQSIRELRRQRINALKNSL